MIFTFIYLFYVFLRGTLLQPNYYAVHFNETLFPEPNKFKPERFVSAEGKLINADQVISFGLGKNIKMNFSYSIFTLNSQ